MNTDETKNDLYGAILKETHNEIQPPDSWHALRNRIDKRVFNEERSHILLARLGKNAAFWRRIALAMAACLVIISALFIYVLSDINRRQQHSATVNQYLLSQKQLEQLGTAFSHVRELFGAQCPWMVIGSSGEGQIGVGNHVKETYDSQGIIVLRLAVNLEGQELKRQYFDIVTFPNQQVSFSMSVAEESDLGVSIKPFMASDGRIAVEIKTGPESGAQAGETVMVANNKFTSLARVKSGDSWVDIDVVGRVVSNI